MSTIHCQSEQKCVFCESLTNVRTLEFTTQGFRSLYRIPYRVQKRFDQGLMCTYCSLRKLNTALEKGTLPL